MDIGKAYLKNEKNEYIILNITLKLNKKPEINISYGDVIKILENNNIKNPTIKDVSNAIISIRNLNYLTQK